MHALMLIYSHRRSVPLAHHPARQNQAKRWYHSCLPFQLQPKGAWDLLTHRLLCIYIYMYHIHIYNHTTSTCTFVSTSTSASASTFTLTYARTHNSRACMIVDGHTRFPLNSYGFRKSCMHMCVYTLTHLHTHTHAYLYTYMYTCIHTRSCIHTCACTMDRWLICSWRCSPMAEFRDLGPGAKWHLSTANCKD